MKNILFAAVIATATCLCAKAEYLYWQVGDSLNGTSFDSSQQYKAYVVAIDEGNDKTYVKTYVAGWGAGNLGMTSVQAADVSNYTTSSFQIEVYAYDSLTGLATSPTASSIMVSYSDLHNINMIRSASNWVQSSLAASVPVWNGTNVVPEPTSGMMMLVGLALLGLKRRRA